MCRVQLLAMTIIMTAVSHHSLLRFSHLSGLHNLIILALRPHLCTDCSRGRGAGGETQPSLISVLDSLLQKQHKLLHKIARARSFILLLLLF